MPFRTSKIILVAAAGLYMLLVVFNNLTDYGSNFAFVSHVLSMDDTFPSNKGMWRSIPGSGWHHFFYVLIILTEACTALLCLAGALRLWRNRKALTEQFNEAKSTAVYGLTLGVLLWFTGFITVGGEWFLMWQSSTWNGAQSAFRIAVLFGILLLYLHHEE